MAALGPEDTVKDLNPNYVTLGAPVDGGCAFTSFKDGASVPTDATAKMNTLADFVSLGELSENGFSMSTEVETTDVPGWHGKTVISCINKETNTFKVEFLEINRDSVAKLKYGEKAVTASAEDKGVSKILGGKFDAKPHPFVFDELESNGYLRRTVFKRAVVSGFDEEAHTKGGAVVYGMTFTALEATDGSEPFVIYRAKPSV